MPDEKPKILTGEHEVKIGGVVVMRKGERVSKAELERRIEAAATDFFEKKRRERGDVGGDE